MHHCVGSYRVNHPNNGSIEVRGDREEIDKVVKGLSGLQVNADVRV